MTALNTTRAMNRAAIFGSVITRVIIILGSIVGAMTISAASEIKDIELIDASGRSRSLQEILPPEPVILHLWATWCAPCRKELPAVARFADELKRIGQRDRLLVIATDNGPYERIASFLGELGLVRLDSWQAHAGRLGTALRIFAYPATVLLDSEDRIIDIQTGSIDWDDVHVREHLFKHLGISPASP